MKRCYYEVLEIDPKSTPADIKASYRKMALKYHPDKNHEADAKQRFVQINEAYEVLSDVNERTWYDNNREKILFNKEDMSKQDIEMYSFGFNIWTYFTVACFKAFDDEQGSFFEVYRSVFEKIKAEEAKSFAVRDDLDQDCRKFEGFGDSATQIEKVLRFYEDWENFTTYKTFVWSEEYDTRDAQNRWVRREMEKQNKKQRQNEKKTYIKTVKDLAAFIKKRDPRYREYLIKVKEEQDRKAVEKIEREKEKKREKQEMKVVKQRMEEERFKEIEEYHKRQNPGLKVQPSDDEADYVAESEYSCLVCEKDFKSENQLRNHEKSKQHKQMVKQIEKQVMLKEQALRKVEEEITEEPPKAELKTKKKNKNKKKNNLLSNVEVEEADEEQPVVPEPVKPKPKQKSVEKPKFVVRQSSSQSEDDFAAALLNNRSKKQTEEEIQTEKKKNGLKKEKNNKGKGPIMESDKSSEEDQGEQKIGKAKLKKQKKSEQEKTKPVGFKCNVCSESFASKTKLFDHVSKSGHASAK